MTKFAATGILAVVIIILVVIIVMIIIRKRSRRDGESSSSGSSGQSSNESTRRRRNRHDNSSRRIDNHSRHFTNAIKKKLPVNSGGDFNLRPYNRLTMARTGTNKRLDVNGTPLHRLGLPALDNIRIIDGVEMSTANSTNWCGYVAASSLTQPAINSCNSVTGTFTVPEITPADSSLNNNVSIWVGIDGSFPSDPTVQQLGVDLTYVNGKTKSYAWFEMYPNNSYEIAGFPADVGDSITTTVSYIGGTNSQQYQLSIKNNTKNISYVVPSFHSTSTKAKRQCVEWLVEAPAIGNSVVPLSSFSPAIVFTDCSATISTTTGNISQFANEEIVMVNSSNATVVKAQPSPLTADGSGFSVTWASQ